MMKSISTDLAVQKIKLPASGRVEYKDSQVKGLILRVSPRGKTWYAAIRPPGDTHPRRIKIGPYGTGSDAFTLKEARRKIDDWKDAVRAGDDPREEGKAKKQQQLNTFTAVVERYLKARKAEVKRGELKQTTFGQYKGILQGKDVHPLNKKPINKITRKQIITLLDEIVDSGRPIMANRTLAALRKFFNWCAKKEIIKHTDPVPTQGVERPINKEPTRSRTLSPAELKVVWRAAEQLGWPFGDHTRLLIATGQRQSECAGITRERVSDGIWDQEGNKAGREHLVPLNSLAVAILEGVPDIPATTKYYLSTTGGSPISGFSKAKRKLDGLIAQICEDEELELFVVPWRTHDIRRTVTTLMRKDLKIPREVCSLILNHAAVGVTGKVYDKYDMLEEKVAALNAWGNYLDSLLHGKPENVVMLKAGET